MSRRYQWLLLSSLGLVVLQVSLTDLHLRFVQPVMQPVLLVTGAILLLLGVSDALISLHRRDRRFASPAGIEPHQHHGRSGAPRMAWLMFLPVLAVTVLAPPALGSFSAERAVDVRLVDLREEDSSLGYPPLAPGAVVPLTLSEFTERALFDAGGSLEGRSIRLSGFVTRRPDGGWFLTRMTMQCCAADAAAIRVHVSAVPAPPVDQWVTVEGTWVPGPTQPIDSAEWQQAQLAASEVRPIEVPAEPYE